MQVIIDADGCPVVSETVQVAKRYKLPVIIVKNYAHQIQDSYAQIVTVDASRDSADFYIVNHMKAGDIVITQDYGLAAMALSKQGNPLTQNGKRLTADNIDYHLERRHHNAVQRRKHKKYSKIKKRTSDDDDAFVQALTEMINDLLSH